MLRASASCPCAQRVVLSAVARWYAGVKLARLPSQAGLMWSSLGRSADQTQPVMATHLHSHSLGWTTRTNRVSKRSDNSAYAHTSLYQILPCSKRPHSGVRGMHATRCPDQHMQ